MLRTVQDFIVFSSLNEAEDAPKKGCVIVLGTQQHLNEFADHLEKSTLRSARIVSTTTRTPTLSAPKRTLPMKTPNRNYHTNAVQAAFFLTFLECVARESSALFLFHLFLRKIFENRVLQILQILHHYSSGFSLFYKPLQSSTKFYKRRRQPRKAPIFLQKVTNSTRIIICRKYKLLIINDLCFLWCL